MASNEVDAVTVRDAGGRRRFIRRGSALLLAGAAATALPPASAQARADCDQRGHSGEKPAGAGSDSDTGQSADRPGCGRREPPKLSEANPRAVPERAVSVTKIVG